MNNEEQLKQEAIAKYKTGSYPQLHPDHYAFIHGYLAGAEPREKRIAELEDKLANADYQLEGRDIKIKELEAQIEKMKCCGNCKHRYFIGDELECRLLDRGINCDDEEKWEIKEND